MQIITISRLYASRTHIIKYYFNTKLNYIYWNKSYISNWKIDEVTQYFFILFSILKKFPFNSIVSLLEVYFHSNKKLFFAYLKSHGMHDFLGMITLWVIFLPRTKAWLILTDKLWEKRFNSISNNLISNITKQ